LNLVSIFSPDSEKKTALQSLDHLDSSLGEAISAVKTMRTELASEITARMPEKGTSRIMAELSTWTSWMTREKTENRSEIGTKNPNQDPKYNAEGKRKTEMKSKEMKGQREKAKDKEKENEWDTKRNLILQKIFTGSIASPRLSSL
jgi:hypothetical protein